MALNVLRGAAHEARGVFGDGLHRPAILDRVKRIDELGFDVEIWSWHDKDLDALAATGARFSSMTGYLHGDLIDPDERR